MADELSRYNMTITLDIRDMKNGEPTEFSRTVQEYADMPYEVMQETQMVGITALLTALGELGNRDAAEIKGKRKPK